MVGFHVFGGILVILCAWGGGFGHFLKFRECFGHYLGFKGNSVLYIFFIFYFFFCFCGALVFFSVSSVFWTFLWLRGHCGHFFDL